jgi:hypothetical protein
MASEGRFSVETIQTLSKRAALLCSNPDCGALTSGPTADVGTSINIGEAAHIYGRTSSAARYKADLTISEIADITNGIWLCKNCHKLIDNDPRRFSAELLFEWRRQHEQVILERVGRPGDKLREKLQAEHLRLFESTSRLAQQIVLDRPPLWEYKLTNELLRTDLGSIQKRWQQLKDGMYVRKSTIIPTDQLLVWLSVKFHDAGKIIQSVQPLIAELNKAFGPPGQPGNDEEILTVCRLIVLAARNFLEWEEDVRFSRVEEEYEEIFLSMQGMAARQLDELLRIPNELSKILAMEDPSGMHEVNLVFTVPEGFADNFNAILKRAFKKVRRGG